MDTWKCKWWETQEMPKEMGVSYGSLQLQEAVNNKDLTAGVFWIMASAEF